MRMLPDLITLLSDLITRVALSFRVLTVSALAALLSSDDPASVVTSGGGGPAAAGPQTDLQIALQSAHAGIHDFLNPALAGYSFFISLQFISFFSQLQLTGGSRHWYITHRSCQRSSVSKMQIHIQGKPSATTQTCEPPSALQNACVCPHMAV